MPNAFPDISKTNFASFMAQFHRMLAFYNTNQDAYEAVERQFEKQHGKRKYSSYNSFQTTMKKKLKHRAI